VSESPSVANGSESSDRVIAEFYGGMNIPAHELWGAPSQERRRVSTAPPMARLTISNDTLRIRPRFSLAFPTFEAPLDQVASAFTVRRTRRYIHAGVGFKLSDGQFAYFWTRADPSPILSVLRDRGVFIDPAQYKAQPGTGDLSRVLSPAPTLLTDDPASASPIQNLRALLSRRR
jgi:hypothetical protein